MTEFVQEQSNSTVSLHYDSGWDNYPLSVGEERNTDINTNEYNTIIDPFERVLNSDFEIYSEIQEPDNEDMDGIISEFNFDIDIDNIPQDIDDMTNFIIDNIHSKNTIKCPICRTENTKEQCVDIKGSGDTCCICLEEKVGIFFIGCGHAATCENCYKKLF